MNIDWYDKKVELLERDPEERYAAFIANGEDEQGDKYQGTAHFYADELHEITDIEPI